MKNKILKFSICDQHIGTDSGCVVADSKNYLLAHFAFDSAWEGIEKTAVFSNGEEIYNMIITDGMCRVPAEVIHGDGFFVSVFGGDLLTADKVKIAVTPSGFAEGITPPEPTPSVYDQLLNLVASEAEAARNSADAAEISAQNAENSAAEAYADRHALLSGGTHWVFDGGNAAGEIFMERVADSVLSETSVNAIQNKTVKAAVDSLSAEIDTVKDEAFAAATAAKESAVSDISSAVADYVISQGKDETTSLYYRKWKSGTAECWGTVDYKGTVNEKIGNRYMGGLISKAFPSGLFNSTPQILVSPKLGQINFSVVRAQWSYASASNSGNYRVISDYELSSTPAETFVISIYAVGTWK